MLCVDTLALRSYYYEIMFFQIHPQQRIYVLAKNKLDTQNKNSEEGLVANWFAEMCNENSCEIQHTVITGLVIS